jgi:hypothetical protein
MILSHRSLGLRRAGDVYVRLDVRRNWSDDLGDGVSR